MRRMQSHIEEQICKELLAYEGNCAVLFHEKREGFLNMVYDLHKRVITLERQLKRHLMED